MSRPLDQAPRGRAAITRPASAHNFVAIVLVQWMTAANRALRTMPAENETSAPCRARRAPVTAMPVAATVVVTSAVPVAAAVAYCQRPGAAAVADCLCSSGSGGDACGGEGGSSATTVSASMKLPHLPAAPDLCCSDTCCTCAAAFAAAPTPSPAAPDLCCT